jgi:hypothetical protein
VILELEVVVRPCDMMPREAPACPTLMLNHLDVIVEFDLCSSSLKFYLARSPVFVGEHFIVFPSVFSIDPSSLESPMA